MSRSDWAEWKVHQLNGSRIQNGGELSDYEPAVNHPTIATEMSEWDFSANLIFWKKSAQQLCENFPLVLLLNPVNSVPLWKLKAVSQETRVFKTKSDKGTKWEKTPSFQKVMGGNFTKLLEEQRRIGSNNSDVIMNNTFIVSKKNDHSFGLFSVFLIKNEESWRYCLFPEGALYFCESQKSKHSPSKKVNILHQMKSK